MGKNYVENSLKRFLKRKVKITMGVVVTFLITGMVSFAKGTAEEGSTQWHKEIAQKYIAGYGRNTDKLPIISGSNLEITKDNSEKLTIKINKIYNNGQEGREVSFLGTNVSDEVLKNLNTTVKIADNLYNNGKIEKITIGENESSEIINGFNFGLEYKNNVNEAIADGEGKISVIEGKISLDNIISVSQKAKNGGIIVNKGVLNVLQSISENSKGYNYGIIISSGKNGQMTNGENAVAYNYGIIANTGNGGQRVNSGNGIVYNYGIIANKESHGQDVISLKGKVYNYGLIINKTYHGQYASGEQSEAYNYGIIANGAYEGQIATGKEAKLYNYGIISNAGAKGQAAQKGEAINILNYGVINNSGSIGQGINEKASKSTLFNYGIISNIGENGQHIDASGTENKAYNYGVVKNKTGKVFEGNVNNYGMVILTDANKQTIEADGLGSGNNKGVVLDKDYKLISGNNNHVTDLTNSRNINITSDKTYYAKDKTVEFSANKLEGNVLTAVVTEKDKTAFKYTGTEELVLKDTTVMGYFEGKGTSEEKGTGTLLELGKDKDLTLIESTINAVSGVGGDVLDVTAVKLNGGTLTLAGDSNIAGKITGKGGIGYNSFTAKDQSFDITGNVTLKNDNKGDYGMADKFTDVSFIKAKADNLILDFAVKDSTNTNKIILENAELGSINGKNSTEKIDLTINNIEKVGNITLGQNDDTFSTTNGTYHGIIDMGDNATDGDTFNILMGAVETEHKKEAGNTFDYKVNGAEKIVLNGEGWHIGENAELNGGTTTKAGEKTELHIADKGSLHVDMNNNYGKGNVTTSLDKMASGADLSVTTGTDAEVKFVVGDKFNVSEKQFEVAHDYSVKDANLGAAVIFKGTGKDGAVEEKDGKIALTVKEASEITSTEGENKGVNLANYKAIYDTMLGALSSNEELRNAVNYSNANNLVDIVVGANNTAEAFYTTGYAVTKDVTDTYMSVVDDFGRKAGKGEWIAFGKYVNSDTEFDGGKASKGYDGDITGTIGMLEYGINDTTSYGVVYGQGDTEVDIQGGGKLDGDNTYFGGYVKHRTQGGFDLTGNVGYTKSELDLNLATSAGVYNMITSGKSDANALTFALKGKKDYLVTDTVKLQPVFGARYTLINQDAVESSDANYRMDEQDVTIFEGILGGNAVKEFDLYNGKLSLSVGAEYVLADVSKSDDARYTLYGKEIALTGEEDIADNRIEGHIGIDYEHESGVGVDTKYEMIWTDKGDNSRVTAGISYRF